VAPGWRNDGGKTRDEGVRGEHNGVSAIGHQAPTLSNRAAFLKSTLEVEEAGQSAGFFLGLASLYLRAWLSLKQRAHAQMQR